MDGVTSSIASMLRLSIVQVMDVGLMVQCRKADTILMFTGESLLVLAPEYCHL